MPKSSTIRLFVLLAILFSVLIYTLVFSKRSPFKDVFFPVIFFQTARDILPDPEPSPNTHNITLTEGSNFHAELLDETEGSVTVRQHYSGKHADRTIDKKDILNIKVNTRALPVSASEIVAKLLFPDMKIHRFENYTIFTDGGYSAVGPTSGILRKLYKQIRRTFPEVIDFKEKTNRICAVVFNSSEEYQKLVAGSGALTQSVGLYSPDHNILFINNDAEIRRAMQHSNDIVRHEGAHQIFYTANLHHGFGLDRLWLVEGLAVYCESSRLGAMIAYRKTSLRNLIQKNALISFKKLLKKKSLHKTDSSDFYDQSWGVVYFLMENYEDEFLQYLKFIKEHPIRSFVTGDARLLKKFLGKDIEIIEQEMLNYWQS